MIASRDLRPEQIVSRDREARHPAGEAREEQTRRLRRRVVQIEELLRSGAAIARLDQHCIGGKETGEENDVGEDEDPEAVADDDALRRRAAGAVAGVLRHARRGRVPDMVGIAAGAQRVLGSAQRTPAVTPAVTAGAAEPRCARRGWRDRDGPLPRRESGPHHGHARRRRRRWRKRRRGRAAPATRCAR